MLGVGLWRSGNWKQVGDSPGVLRGILLLPGVCRAEICSGCGGDGGSESRSAAGLFLDWLDDMADEW